MIPRYDSHPAQLLGAPTQGWCQFSDERIGCFVVSLFVLAAANVMKKRRKLKNGAVAGIFRDLETVIKLKGQTRNVNRVLEVWIEEGSPQPEAAPGGGFNLFPFRQLGSPDVPQGSCADHLLAILVDAASAFFDD